MKTPIWNNIKKIFKKTKVISTDSHVENTHDNININIWGLNLSVDRNTSLDIPTELSVIIPRVEMRHKYTAEPYPSYEKEIIMSSITVVLSPRHPSEKGASLSTNSAAGKGIDLIHGEKSRKS